MFGVIADSQSHEECVSLSESRDIGLILRVTDITLDSTQESAVTDWKPSYLPLPSGFMEGREERCTLYPVERQEFSFSKLHKYRIRILSTRTIDDRLRNARLVFVGQG